jgi:hypothetical protein
MLSVAPPVVGANTMLVVKKYEATMSGAVGSNEIRVVIRPIESPGFEPERIPAQAFKKIFDAFLAALLAADRELHPKSGSSEFFLSHLAMESCEFGIMERQKSLSRSRGSAIELLRRCSGRVYRSDYQILLRYPRLMRAFHRIIKALDPAYVVLVRHEGAELPLDDFFCRQVDRVGQVSDALSRADAWFAGTAITSFEGRLESIDYRGLVWRGQLALAGAAAEIECVFDRSRGEDALNPFGNKTVCVTGRAIYTGDSQLPERIEVLTLEEVDRAAEPIDIQGSLAPAPRAVQDSGLDHIQ